LDSLNSGFWRYCCTQISEFSFRDGARACMRVARGVLGGAHRYFGLTAECCLATQGGRLYNVSKELYVDTI